MYETALTHLGLNTSKHQDWFDDNDDEIKKLLGEKRDTHRAHQQDRNSASKKAAYYSTKRKVQTKLREMQDSWLIKKADEIQQYADSNNSKRFSDALKTIYGLRSPGASPLLGDDGSTLFTDKSAIVERWAEHFSNVLNRPSSISAEAIARMPQVEINTLAEHPKELDQRYRKQLIPFQMARHQDQILFQLKSSRQEGKSLHRSSLSFS